MSDYQKLVDAVKQTASTITSAVERARVLKALPELKKAYEKSQSGSGKRHRMKGRGFLEWLSGAFSDANNWLKENKILSKIASPVLEYIIPAAAGVFGTPVSGATAAIAGKAATEGLKALGYGRKKKMMRGGDSRLTIMPAGQRLGQRGSGLTISYNGMYAQAPRVAGKGCGCGYGRMTGGAGSQYYSISSEFGKIKA
jgi:hypothetical protein